MKTADKVIATLYDRREGFFPFAELAKACGLDRARLGRALEQLRQQGHELDVSPSIGARLCRPVRPRANLIERDLGTRRIGKNVICFEGIDSTNDVAFSCAPQDGSDGLVVLAEYQRKGRGRHGRKWLSSPHANILMSVLLTGQDSASRNQEALTIAAGLAVAEGIEEACGLPCRLKWPNDVLLDGAKVAGVLVEVKNVGREKPGPAAASPIRKNETKCTVIGIGINVGSVPSPDLLARPVACLQDRLGEPVERIEVVRAVLRRLDDWVAQLGDGRTEELHYAWTARCDMINHRLAVSCAGHRYVGRVLDVSPLEGLILLGDDGVERQLAARLSSIEE